MLAPASEHELSRLENAIADFRGGALALDDFRRRRSAFGIYGMRGTHDRVVVRIKVPAGRLSADDLIAVGELLAHRPTDRCHITTRQALQLYNLPLESTPGILRTLGRAGLSTLESAGNRVRNIATCSLAGVCMNELFDVTPFALAAASFFHGNPDSSALPRKLKIGFSGCGRDCSMTATHDVGVLAAIANPSPDGAGCGFRIYAGGGLGRAPREAQLLEPFTPAVMLLPTLDAIVRVFSTHGDRTNRAQARLKFLVQRIGFDMFRQLVLDTRNEFASGVSYPAIPTPHHAFAATRSVQWAHHCDPGYDRWLATNATTQRQAGYAAITVRVPEGDLSSRQCIGLGAIARSFSRSQVIATQTQNVVLPWVELHNLAIVYGELQELDLAAAEAERIQDVVSCPGAGTCQIGITASKNLAQSLAAALDKPEYKADDISPLRIRVSGCPNGCSRHHVADIGFCGTSIPAHGLPAMHYDLLLGGGVKDGHAWFGESVGRIPAGHVPEALETVLRFYHHERQPGEMLPDVLRRIGTAPFHDLLVAHAAVEP